MPRSDIPAQIKAEYDRAFQTLYGMEPGLQLGQFKRAIDIAFANGFTPVRFVISRRVSRRLGRPVKAIYGIPVQVDEDTDEGFGLITRSGSAPS